MSLRCVSVIIALGLTAPAMAAPAWRATVERAMAIASSDQIDVLITFRTDDPALGPAVGSGPGRERANGGSGDTISRATQSTASTLAALGVEILATYDHVPTLLARINRDQIPDIEGLDEVISVAPDRLHRHHAAEAPSERQLLSVSTDAINARAAWASGFAGANQVIAILDDGIAATHEMFLGGKIVLEACFSGGGGGQSLCPGGVRRVMNETGAASSCSGGTNVCSHGSHVAGIAAGAKSPFVDGSANTENTRLGVAPRAALVPIQVFSRYTTGCEETSPCLRSTTSNELAALNYLIDIVERGVLTAPQQLVAVNMSLGGDPDYGDFCYDDPLQPAIRKLRQLGVLTTISSGNDETNDRLSTPACIKDAITVDASNRTNTNGVSYSNSARGVDIVAPGGTAGGAIVSAGIASPTSYVGFTGTSMAAPHVAGAIAVLRSKAPAASADEVEWALRKGAARQLIYAQDYKRWPEYFLDVGRALAVLGEKPALGVPLAGFFPAAFSGGISSVRIYNPGTTAGIVNLSLVRDDTGEVLGSSPRSIPGRAALQFQVPALQAEIGGRAGDVPAEATLSIYVDSPFLGYAQNIFLNAGTQVLTNLTSCNDNQPDFNTMLGNVHTALLDQDYPSILRIHNAGPFPTTAVFDIFDATTGTRLGSWTTPDQIAANTTRFYSAMTAYAAIGYAPPAGAAHTTFILKSDPTFVLGHVVRNVAAGLMTDMTAKCRI